MSQNYLETLRNGRRYIESSRHSYKAKIMNGGGYTSCIDTINRSYHLTLQIDKSAELAVLQIEPSIHCLREAMDQTASYISRINAHYKCCNLRMKENGTVYIQCEQRFNEDPITSDLFETMEIECLKILDTFEVAIQKTANIKLLSLDEADPDKVIEKHRQKFREMLLKSLGERTLKNINSLDMEDNDLPDDSYIPFLSTDEDYDDEENGKIDSRVEVHNFIDWLKERDRNKTEENSDETNKQKPTNLLSQLLSLDANKHKRQNSGDTLEIPSINASDTIEFEPIEED